VLIPIGIGNSARLKPRTIQRENRRPFVRLYGYSDVSTGGNGFFARARKPD
jgi:hypothetical protein